MKATVPMLLASTVVTGFAPQAASQEPHQPKVSSRRPVDVSVEGLGQATPRAPGDTPGGASIGFSARPSPGGLDTPFDCLESIADQAAGGCLTASSAPTLGMLYPYPGLNNTFVPQAFVGGGEDNRATGLWSTVGGGARNNVSGNSATIGGGYRNTATRALATVAGGYFNTASGANSTVGGGEYNTASGSFATVGGGHGNAASGKFATVAGGGGQLLATSNTASGDYATVGGGRFNVARGNHSFAAGHNARANHNGAFVWGDSQFSLLGKSKSSSASDQFNVYCSGGARFFTSRNVSTGVLLAAGGSTWTMVSDQDAKENFESVDARAVLDKVADLPLSTWNYKAQDDSIRHMGPMAQDFYAAFGLGLGDKTIDTIDPNGVALAAIQGLHELAQEKDAEIEELRAANKTLLARVERLEKLADR